MPKDVDWESLKAEYLAGGVSYSQLAAKYGTNKSQICKRIKREGWDELRKRIGNETETKLVDAVSDAQVDSMLQAVRIARSYMDWLEEWIAESRADDRQRKSIDLANVANAMSAATKNLMMVERRPNIQEQTALDKLRLDQKRFEAEQAAKEAENSDDDVKIIVEVPEGLVIDE